MMEFLQIIMNIGKKAGHPISCINNKYFLLFMIAVSLLFSACRHHPKQPIQPDYGTAYNHVRDCLGIKPIPSDYVAEESKDSYEGLWIDYTDPNLRVDSMSTLPKAYYWSKALRIINDTLMFERDDYVLMRFPTPNQHIPLAILSYSYFYNTNRYNPFMLFNYILYAYPDSDTIGALNDPYGLSISWIDGNTRRDSLGELLPMTRAEADSILATWGMKYP